MKKLFQSDKDLAVAEMKEIYKYLITAGNERIRYSEFLREFGANMREMVVSQNEDVIEYMDRFRDLFTQISECQYRLAKAEMRNAEDFNDVSERFFVYYRVNDEYKLVKEKFNKCSKDLKEARQKNEVESQKATYHKNKEKLIANIEKLVELKRELLEQTKCKLEYLIKCRELYASFKIRRFKEGWTNYGRALKTESERELAIIGKIEDLLNELQGKVSNIDGIMTDTADALAVQPQPQQMPDINHGYDESQVTTNPLFSND